MTAYIQEPVLLPFIKQDDEHYQTLSQTDYKIQLQVV